KNPEKGQINLADNHELVPDTRKLFDDLKRIDIDNRVRRKGWNVREVAELAISELNRTGNCLVIVNTKKWAQELYIKCEELIGSGRLYHLSTNQCASHRKTILDQIRND